MFSSFLYFDPPSCVEAAGHKLWLKRNKTISKKKSFQAHWKINTKRISFASYKNTSIDKIPIYKNLERNSLVTFKKWQFRTLEIRTHISKSGCIMLKVFNQHLDLELYRNEKIYIVRKLLSLAIAFLFIFDLRRDSF